MQFRFSFLSAAVAALGLALSPGAFSAGGAVTLLNVSYDPTREFYAEYNQVFAKHWQAYGLSGPDDPALRFYQIHTVQEPLHGEYGLEALKMYLHHVPTDEAILVEGVAEWMAIYERWLAAFRDAFFS